MPESWRAAVLRQPGTCLELVDIFRPELLSGQVLVELDYSGVCRSQLMEVRGLRGPDAWLPHLLGHEGVGTVAEIGPDVTKVAAGDRVVVGWIMGEGIESASPTFTTVHGERVNAGRVTTFSEYTVVSENRVYLQPAEVDDRAAVLFGCALLTGAGMVLNEARPSGGESVLINGLGGIGLAALIATQGLGVEVVAADPDPEKRELARGLGAQQVLDPYMGTLHDQVFRHFPCGVDVAIDAAGTTAGIEAAFACLRYEGGRRVFASHPSAGERISLDPHDLINGRMIRGSWGGACRPDRDIPRLARVITDAGTNLDFMMPRTYALDEVNRALDDL
ncbi:MAG: zinc-binding dehydrogenase, partial [Ilumatobacter sp.]|nr:zinc-binding dehydrogenase [Ilumatobacter sp.]